MQEERYIPLLTCPYHRARLFALLPALLRLASAQQRPAVTHADCKLLARVRGGTRSTATIRHALVAANDSDTCEDLLRLLVMLLLRRHAACRRLCPAAAAPSGQACTCFVPNSGAAAVSRGVVLLPFAVYLLLFQVLLLPPDLSSANKQRPLRSKQCCRPTRL